MMVAIQEDVPWLPTMQRPPPSQFRLFLSASCAVGFFTMWSFEYALAVPYFNSVLGFDREVASMMWIAGPVSGLLVGPIVGVLSDRCTSRMGRRRPFIIIGALLTVVFGMLYSNALYLTAGDNARILGGVCFALMDLTINMMMNPTRALLSDIAGPEKQVPAQCAFAFLCGVGYVLGYTIVWVTGDAWRENMFQIYSAGCCVLVLTTIVTVVTSPEVPASMTDAQDGSLRVGILFQIRSVFADLFGGIAKLPPSVRSIAACQVLSWFAWFCFSQVLTEFFGVVIFDGDPDATCVDVTNGQLCEPPACDPCSVSNTTRACSDLCRYQHGVSKGTLGLLLQNIVTASVSVSFLLMQDRFQKRRLYLASLIFHAAVFFTLSFKHDNLNLAVACVAATGIALAGAQVFPFALIGSTVKNPERKGLAMGVLTICTVLPQFVDTTYVGLLAKAVGLPWVFCLGGCYASAACLAALWLPAL
eukprot:TRINITY_DN67135_c0_g1_i1.p1 TRINITY_DN67135_c0_g1~~TRINITY_DN67135_c0_g1_i1.p1  ORF type:complete len:474 (+),score=47.35 TRINITY_DN67135_c0_g1_i1:42-1463(+)